MVSCFMSTYELHNGISGVIAYTNKKDLGPVVQNLTLVLQNKLDAMPTSNFHPIRVLDLDCCYKFILNDKQCRSRSVGF